MNESIRYCKECGCYIPHNVTGCLACGCGAPKKPKKMSKSETNKYMPTDEASRQAIDQAQMRREQMQEQFARHKAAAESRKAERE